MNCDDYDDELKISEKTLKRCFVQARINKLCSCQNKTINIDLRSREIECGECGARLDPFDTLVELYRQESYYWIRLKSLKDQCEKLEKWLMNNRMGQTLRKLAAEIRANKLPCCPHCGEAVDLTTINTYCSKDYVLYANQNRL